MDQTLPLYRRAVTRIFRLPQSNLEHASDIPRPYQTLTGYNDSDRAGDIDTRRSTSAYVFTVGSVLISRSFKCQSTIAVSTCEAEHTGHTQTAKEAVRLRSLPCRSTGNDKHLESAVVRQSSRSYCTGQNPQFHARTKHLDNWIHDVRDLVASKQVGMQYVPTKSPMDWQNRWLETSSKPFRKALCVASGTFSTRLPPARDDWFKVLILWEHVLRHILAISRISYFFLFFLSFSAIFFFIGGRHICSCTHKCKNLRLCKSDEIYF